MADEVDDRLNGANALNEVRRDLPEPPGDEGELGSVMTARLELAAAVAVDNRGSNGTDALLGDALIL